MAFTGDEGKMIDPAIAQQWIDNYQKSAGPGALKAEFFGFRRLAELLGQGDAIGVRIYYAKNDAGEDKLVLVAVTPSEKNIGKIDGSKSVGMVLEEGVGCPPYCNNVD
ncbi:MAG TPA: hypothetical protein VFE50_06515 [Cyclobacteriaceae bacterium]|nr:hypothetical protein [Cyclobacteriaceae bacterium]